MTKLIQKIELGTGVESYGKVTASEIEGTLDANYIHVQNTPESTWTIQHNLGKYPSVTVVDSANSVVVGNITYTDDNNLVLNFNGGFAGKAYLN